MLEIDDHLQTINIEEQRTIANPVEKLKEILLDNSRPDRTTKVGTLANSHVHQALTSFLRKNQDIFTWNHEDMPGINPSVMAHRLNVSLIFPPIH